MQFATLCLELLDLLLLFPDETSIVARLALEGLVDGLHVTFKLSLQSFHFLHVPFTLFTSLTLEEGLELLRGVLALLLPSEVQLAVQFLELMHLIREHLDLLALGEYL